MGKMLRLLVVVAAVVFAMPYWSCLTWFGFPATTFIFLLYWLWILERESWRRIALVSVSATVGLYVVFKAHLLGVSALQLCPEIRAT